MENLRGIYGLYEGSWDGDTGVDIITNLHSVGGAQWLDDQSAWSESRLLEFGARSLEPA